MQTLYTIEDVETGGVKTLLHVSGYTNSGTLVVIVYVSDEYGNHKRTVRKYFTNTIDAVYHAMLRKKIKKDGGIIHKRISDTPLLKTKQVPKPILKRDSLGKFCK